MVFGIGQGHKRIVEGLKISTPDHKRFRCNKKSGVRCPVIAQTG